MFWMLNIVVCLVTAKLSVANIVACVVTAILSVANMCSYPPNDTAAYLKKLWETQFIKIWMSFTESFDLVFHIQNIFPG
jgi:hypothetical protein